MSEASPDERQAASPIVALLAEDLDAGFVELVRQYQQPLYSVAVRVCGAAADADDLCAEAFGRAYRALRGYSRQRIVDLRPRAWLVTIVLNTWRNTLRQASRRPWAVPLDHGVDPPATGRSSEDWAERDDSMGQLARMVGRLSEAQRTAVVLRHVLDCSTAEIADVLGCPEGTAKSHVSRGMHRLRSLYAVEPNPDGRSSTGGP